VTGYINRVVVVHNDFDFQVITLKHLLSKGRAKIIYPEHDFLREKQHHKLGISMSQTSFIFVRHQGSCSYYTKIKRKMVNTIGTNIYSMTED
ncbi:hypothetical protein ACJX0J_018270, partial [Zea mays]